MRTPIVRARHIVNRIATWPLAHMWRGGLRERRRTPCRGHFEISGNRAAFKGQARSFAAGTAGHS